VCQTPSYTPPYPTLIEYSGYGYANPAGPESGIAVLANLMGFAVVDVNMRGTGCSGGAFDFFEPLQNLDGYDVIETIAHQPWVLGNKVGMLGISYGGISQLFTAQLQPPDLEAISPVSVIDATATTLYPGGILNDGFAVAWSEQRQQNAEPAGPGMGQEWAYKRVQEGDATCAANQALHGQAANLGKKIQETRPTTRRWPTRSTRLTFVKKINVPTFMACQWEDEQTGGHCADLAQHFTGTTRKWFTFTNGAHIDSLDPYTYNRLYDFLELYVAHKAPIENQAPVRAAAPLVYKEAMGLPEGDVVPLPPDPIQEQPTYESALAAFEALPEIRVLFDNGAGEAPTGGTTAAGNPYPGFEQSFSAFPIPGTTAQSWYFQPGGTLGGQKPTAEGVDSYTSDANAVPLTDYSAKTGTGRAVGQRIRVGMELGAAAGRLRRVLCLGAAHDQHHRHRWGRSAPLGQVIHSGCRSPGDRQRSASRRQRDVRPERLDPRERAQARHHLEQHLQAEAHAAPADPDDARIRCRTHARGSVRPGHHPAVLPGARIPGGLPHQGHDCRTQRNTADLVVQPHTAGGHHGDGVGRLLFQHAVEPHPPDRAQRQRAHGDARLPEPAQRALPPLPGIREQRLLKRLMLRERGWYSDARSASPARGVLPISLREEQQNHAWLSYTTPFLIWDFSTCPSSPSRRLRAFHHRLRPLP